MGAIEQRPTMAGLSSTFARRRGPNSLTVGEATMPRGEASSASAVTLTSGILRLTYFTADKTETVASLRLRGGTTAAGVTPTLVRFGIYSVAGNGDLTLVASIASDTSLFAVASTSYTRALESSWAKVADTRYAIGGIAVTAATAPTLVGQATTPDSDVAPVMSGRVTGQTDLPATIAAASITAYESRFYAALVP